MSPLKRQLSSILRDAPPTAVHSGAPDLTRSISDPLQDATAGSAASSSDAAKSKASVRSRLASANADPKNHTVSFNKADHSVTLIPSSQEDIDVELTGSRSASELETAVVGDLTLPLQTKHDQTDLDLDHKHDPHHKSDVPVTKDDLHNSDIHTPALRKQSFNDTSQVNTGSTVDTSQGDTISDKQSDLSRESASPILPPKGLNESTPDETSAVTAAYNGVMQDGQYPLILPDQVSPHILDEALPVGGGSANDEHRPQDSTSVPYRNDTAVEEVLPLSEQNGQIGDTQQNYLREPLSASLAHENEVTNGSNDPSAPLTNDVWSHNQRNLQQQPKPQGNLPSVQGIVHVH